MKKFVEMCQKIGAMPDYVQGGGGNASVKVDGNKMAIKASGYTLKDITEETGYVNVDYVKIKAYHTDVPPEELEMRESESTKYTLSCVFPSADGKALRPSVEAGFHSLMKKYVMHTHPVYTNVIACAEGGKGLAEKICKDLDFVWIPYINPGFSLTLVIQSAISSYENEHGVFPKVIFLENHGLITTSDDADECVELHIKVNNAIKDYLKLKDFYSELKLEKEGEFYIGTSPFVAGFLSEHSTDEIMKTALYPDQLVYLNKGMQEGKIIVYNDYLLFKTSEKEASAIYETFAAFVYITDCLKSLNMNIHNMDSAATGFINNWESEKYRRNVTSK
ncbi:MAG: class II aldolase [Clostridia bacterium]|nr:class II aldolase [Clostridia bacterium]